VPPAVSVSTAFFPRLHPAGSTNLELLANLNWWVAPFGPFGFFGLLAKLKGWVAPFGLYLELLANLNWWVAPFEFGVKVGIFFENVTLRVSSVPSVVKAVGFVSSFWSWHLDTLQRDVLQTKDS
jgi:hypothetical protein